MTVGDWRKMLLLWLTGKSVLVTQHVQFSLLGEKNSLFLATLTAQSAFSLRSLLQMLGAERRAKPQTCFLGRKEADGCCPEQTSGEGRKEPKTQLENPAAPVTLGLRKGKRTLPRPAQSPESARLRGCTSRSLLRLLWRHWTRGRDYIYSEHKVRI